MPAITMLTTSASPECILKAGKTYLVPKDMAKTLLQGQDGQQFARPATPSEVEKAETIGKPDPGERLSNMDNDDETDTDTFDDDK